MNIKECILSETRDVIEGKGIVCPELSPELRFLEDLPMDSLDLATLIVGLESKLKLDPFREGFKAFNTLDELIALYQSAYDNSTATA